MHNNMVSNTHIQGGPKSKPLPNDQKSYYGKSY